MWDAALNSGQLEKLSLSRRSDAFDDDAFGFEVGDTVVGAVAHHDGLLEEGDERAGGLGEPAVGGLVPIDGEVVGGVASGTGQGCLEPALEGAVGELADWFGAGTDGRDSEVHLFDRLSARTGKGEMRGLEGSRGEDGPRGDPKLKH